MKEIIKAALNYEKISKKQIVKLLKTDTKSPEFYELICAANMLSR